MAFTAGELENIANAALDYYFKKGSAFQLAINAKPTVKKLESKAVTFPGGKGDIVLPVQGDYGAGGVNDTLKGYTHDDTLPFMTPANIKQVKYPWRETHLGLTVSYTEAKIDGISIADTSDGSGMRKHSRREMTVLVNLLENKIKDLGECSLRGLNGMFWGDGTADAAGFAGIQSIVVENPTTGTVGGLASTNTWWRNQAATTANGTAGGQGAITSDPANGGALATFLNEEWRRITLMGGRPDYFPCGSDFMGALETEFRANGYYSGTGFGSGGEVGVGGLKIKGLELIHDPWLDQNGKSKFGYMLDTDAIRLQKMEGEWRRNHTPARPFDKMVLHRSITWTGQITASRRDSSGVYEIT